MKGLLLLVLSFVLSSCRCAEPTDEEILRERIDTTKVHLYLASKIAILKGDQSPDARAAREALLTALQALEGQPAEAHADGQPRRELTAADLLKLAQALYALKQEGEALLHSGDEKGMKPILPLLFAPQEPLASALDLHMEHALLLTGGFLLKFHPRSPAPIPAEVLLYEAWMSDTERLLPGLRSLVRVEKAVVYGTNELCDLAAKEAKGAEAEQASYEEFVRVLQVAGTQRELAAEQVRQSLAAVRALAHGVSAYCYRARDEGTKELEELELTLTALSEAGVPEGELALVRATMAMQKGEPAKARQHLETARDYPRTSEAEKKDIEAILAELDDDPNVLEEKLGKGWFTFYLVKIVLRRLDEAGAFEELKKTELVLTLSAFLQATTQASEGAKSAVSNTSKGVVDRVKGLFSGE